MTLRGISNASAGSAPLIPQAYTWATKPVASAGNLGTIIRITDVGANTGGGGGNFFFSNGTRWKAAGGNIILDAVDTPNSGTATTTEQQLNPNHIVIPAGLLGDFDRLRLSLGMSKNGTVDTATINLRFGPLGTIADPVIAIAASMVTTNQSFGLSPITFKRLSATSIIKSGGGGNFGFGNSGPSNSAPPAAFTVSNMDTNPMYLSITSTMTTGVEICILQDYTLEVYPTDSA